MHDSSTSRRSLLRTAVWAAPAVTVAAAAPAFAASQARASLTYTSTAPDAGDITVENPDDESVAIELVFTPSPDEDVVHSLVAHSGFEGLTRTSSDPYTLAGNVPAGQRASGWGWWRTRAGEAGTTTLTLRVDGTTIDTLQVSLQG